MNSALTNTLNTLSVPEYVENIEQALLVNSVSNEPVTDLLPENINRLVRLAFVYEVQGLAEYNLWIQNQSQESFKQQFEKTFEQSFICWRSFSSSLWPTTPWLNGFSDHSTNLLDIEENQDLAPELLVAFRLAVSGLMSTRTAETRLELNKFTITPTDNLEEWNKKVADSVLSSFVLLVRKANGWEDITNALYFIERLRNFQAQYESRYLDTIPDSIEQTSRAVKLVGLYHLAQILTVTGNYLKDSDVFSRVQIQLDRHHQRAFEAFNTINNSSYAHLTNLLWIGCKEIVQNSIWTHVESLGEAAKNFANLLVHDHKSKPVIELWKGQQEAFANRLFDPYPRAIIVQMPTSAGKTLLAKFLIVQTKALNPNGKIVYIVPTRALVNQITIELRQDFTALGFRVEQTVPAFELDPTEERLLKNSPDVLITTPEKLDLLIRSDHVVTKDLALVIADEAHNISDGSRGARLELLLGTIKRERRGTRFLLLSPFLPNGNDLVYWLGEERSLDPITIDWKPSRKIVGSVRIQGRGNARKSIFRTLPATGNIDVKPGIEFSIGTGSGFSSTSISAITAATVKALIDKGAILILCRGKGTASKRAVEIAEQLGTMPENSLVEAVCNFIDAEIGRKSILSICLRNGVAYHHAGLSQETRWLIEILISRGFVRVVCGTTTLAQGMNFPIRTVIVETLVKGSTESPLTYQDFWNIAGRAGRTLVDTLGVISFPERNATDRAKYVNFLGREAEIISSQLADLVIKMGELQDDFHFNLDAVRTYPQLSSLLQFLAHAMRVSGDSDLADEVEDLLRASLAYYQIRRRDTKMAQRLINICRLYLQQIKLNKNILPLADKTGFATPSVLKLLAETKNQHEFTDVNRWQPERLFGDNIEPMRQRVEAIANLPEIDLGQSSQFPFSAELVAKILRDWVKGDALDELAKKYWLQDEADEEKRLTKFSTYLFSKIIGTASWGMGALETVALGDIQQEQWESVGYIPSMIFFGVQNKESIWLRMVGLPRIIASGIGKIWESEHKGEPESYDTLRSWVDNLSDEQWRSAIPKGKNVTAADMKIVWNLLAGK